VHANLIEGFWELALALPGDNLRQSATIFDTWCMQGRKASVGTHTLSLLGCPSGSPVVAPVALCLNRRTLRPWVSRFLSSQFPVPSSGLFLLAVNQRQPRGHSFAFVCASPSGPRPQASVGLPACRCRHQRILTKDRQNADARGHSFAFVC
jgi:hypothetical protein